MKKLAISLVAFMSFNSIAATENLFITGTIATQCAFSGLQTGNFGFDPASPNILDTATTGGNSARVDINYIGLPNVTAVEIGSFATVPNGFVDPVTFTNVFTSANLGTIPYSNGFATFTATGNTTDTLTLRLRAVNGNGAFPVGTYTASTVVTCQ